MNVASLYILHVLVTGPVMTRCATSCVPMWAIMFLVGFISLGIGMTLGLIAASTDKVLGDPLAVAFMLFVIIGLLLIKGGVCTLVYCSEESNT